MDSLTQITLGAAVAEVVAGKKLGNRAMIWGAIAGTIPDLDILGNFFMNGIEALAFHRGISHSFFFAIVLSLILGQLVPKIYASKYHRYVGFFCWTSLLILIYAFIYSQVFKEHFDIGKFLILTLPAVGIAYLLQGRYFRKSVESPNISSALWTKLFFWSIVTHPILDCFTTYGTQIFLPFSNYRVSFNNISVVDPIYTVPFLLTIIIASFYSRNSLFRQRLVWAGITVSSIYMVLTIGNKLRINSIFNNTLVENGIAFDKYLTSPSILNNVLWYGCAMTKDTIHFGFYSLLDKEKKFQLMSMPIHEDWLQPASDDKVINTLKWFSNGYYSVIRTKAGSLQFNDMRYGNFSEGLIDERDFIFRFEIEKNGNTGKYELINEHQGPPDYDRKAMMIRLWSRIKGI